MSPFGDRRRLSIGLLGGSFNPAHAGHAHIARHALRALRLDQVWLLVSPGNPLKNGAEMASLERRLASARGIGQSAGKGRRIIATSIETALGTRYTADTIVMLRRRFPYCRFVWLMGADNLRQLPRWNRWRDITAMVPMAVFPRPGESRRALAGQAARALRAARQPAHAASVLATMPPPAWIWLPIRENSLSATALRRKAGGLSRGTKGDTP